MPACPEPCDANFQSCPSKYNFFHVIVSCIFNFIFGRNAMMYDVSCMPSGPLSSTQPRLDSYYFCLFAMQHTFYHAGLFVTRYADFVDRKPSFEYRSIVTLFVDLRERRLHVFTQAFQCFRLLEFDDCAKRRRFDEYVVPSEPRFEVRRAFVPQQQHPCRI